MNKSAIRIVNGKYEIIVHFRVSVHVLVVNMRMHTILTIASLSF